MSIFSEEDYELMDNYMHRNLNNAEERAFEERLRSDDSFAAEFQWVQKLRVNYAHMKWKDYFKETHERLTANDEVKEEKDEPAFWVQWGRKLSIAASVLLVLGSAGYYFLSKQETGNLANKPHGHVLSPAKRIEDIPDNLNTALDPIVNSYALQLPKDLGKVPAELESAIAAYKDDQAGRAIALLIKPIEQTPAQVISDPDNVGSAKGDGSQARKLNKEKESYRHLYLALSYIKTNQVNQALDEIKKAGYGETKASAEWYESLCYLKLNQIPAAKAILKSISENDKHPYQPDAQEVLTSIK
jgi:hypothetical protein